MKILNPTHKPMFGSPVAPWHWWFAWHPVFTWDGRFIWFAIIKRRRIQKHTHLNGGADAWWEYHQVGGYCKKPTLKDANETD